ncbi:ABC-type zinc uptake system zinc chaperone [Shewanella waksmanii]|uniref:ABC-type zinc uptake system zinc chaperone n=1 Tax=Shewanella waksmanii TaxID=213783 RepID=UPI0037361C0F
MFAMRRKITQGVAIWLSALLFCLSVATSAHSVEHIDHGALNDCTLCIQKLQLNTIVPCSEHSFTLGKPSYVPQVEILLASVSSDSHFFDSRAPPL